MILNDAFAYLFGYELVFFFLKDILLIELSFIKCLSVLDFVFILVIEISC